MFVYCCEPWGIHQREQLGWSGINDGRSTEAVFWGGCDLLK